MCAWIEIRSFFPDMFLLLRLYDSINIEKVNVKLELLEKVEVNVRFFLFYSIFYLTNDFNGRIHTCRVSYLWAKSDSFRWIEHISRKATYTHTKRKEIELIQEKLLDYSW